MSDKSEVAVMIYNNDLGPFFHVNEILIILGPVFSKNGLNEERQR